MLTTWLGLARWRDWAQSKLPFLAAVTVLLSEASAPRVLAIVATVVAGAAFGYAVNEVADRSSDALAGKRNRAAGLARNEWLSFVVLAGGGALGLSLLWAPDATAPILVAAGLGLAVAYSVRPLRLEERGALGPAGAAAAQWAVPVLVVAAAEPGGWLRPEAFAFALLGVAIGTRWIIVHQHRDAAGDARSGVRTWAGGGRDVAWMLAGLVAAEVLLLGAGVAWTWPHSVPVVAAFSVCVLDELRRGSLVRRLHGYEAAPLTTFYFLALPISLAVTADSITLAALLVVVAVPQLVALTRAMASMAKPVVRASEPQP